MIAEAVDTVITLGWALRVWILLCAATATLGLYAVAVAVWCAVQATMRGVKASRALLYASLVASTPPKVVRELRDAPRASQAPSRPGPSWARTDKEDAA